MIRAFTPDDVPAAAALLVRRQGYPVICSDWRSTNLTAARTWPSLGYAQTFLRLHRLVGH